MPDEPRTFHAGGPIGNGSDSVFVFEPGCDYIIFPVKHAEDDDHIIRGRE